MEKKYLNIVHKIGYGSGDWAANMVYGIVTSFMMLYLTNTVGMDAGIVGTLILISKLLDGVTDVVFGLFIDRTNTRMGKARPWMLFSYLGNTVCLIALFAIPLSMERRVQYAYFFIAYTLLNAVFYTANNIAYSALTSLITRNGAERVQLGTFRFIFSAAANLSVSTLTLRLVDALGSGAVGWRNTAVLYGFVGLLVNTLSVFSVKELEAEEASSGEREGVPDEKRVSFIDTIKTLLINPYFDMLSMIYVLGYLNASVSMGVAIYYFIYLMGKPDLFGGLVSVFSIASMVGLVIVPFLVKRFRNIRIVNLASTIIQIPLRACFVAAAVTRNATGLLFFFGLCSLTNCATMGTFNALVAEASEYTRLKTGKNLDGSMYSCTSFGMKVGGGIGSGISGWLLAASGFNAAAAVQAPAVGSALIFMFAVIPLIVTLITAVLYYFLKVEKENSKLRQEGN